MRKRLSTPMYWPTLAMAGWLMVAAGAATADAQEPTESQAESKAAVPAVAAVAAPPPSVTPLLQYQGRLTNPSTGAPLDGDQKMTFHIYDVESGGTALWTEAKTIPVARGLFSTLLGDTDVLDPAVFGGQDLWLGIQVGEDPEATPRQRIAPTAYALHARDSETVGGKSAWAFSAAGHNHDTTYINSTGPDTMSGSSIGPILDVTQASTGAAGQFSSVGGYGVIGSTDSATPSIAGVRGQAGSAGVGISQKHGVQGQSDTGRGVVGMSRDSTGVYGWSTNNTAIRGEASSASSVAIHGFNAGSGGTAVRGQTASTSGVTLGVLGESASSTGVGVRGVNSATTGQAYGVHGMASSTDGGAAVRADGQYVGVRGESDGRWGVYGRANADANAYGVFGTSSGAGSYAGYFQGNGTVTGTFSKGGGSFRIDHPLDPENKYLQHSFVESPDMMNIYNGNATLDEDGAVWIELPEWFEPLNRDFRYQLTPIGGPGPGLYVANEVKGNRFRIAGGAPGLKVSWQVTGIRHDAFAEANRIPVESDKTGEEKGTYLHPEAFGVSPSRGLAVRTAPRFENPVPEP